MLCERGCRSSSRRTKCCCRRSLPPRSARGRCASWWGSTWSSSKWREWARSRESPPSPPSPPRTVASGVWGSAALTDISPAEWHLGRLGELNRLDVPLARGASRERVLNSIRNMLPPGVHVATVDSLEQASGYPSRAYRVNLNVLAMVALFTGGFLVFSAQALEMARRRGEQALLRVLGLSSSGLARLCLAEAAVLGVLGGIAGVALGYGCALLALRYAGADLGAGQLRGIAPHLAFQPIPASLYVIAGAAVAVLGALLPALDAARTPPARADRKS